MNTNTMKDKSNQQNNALRAVSRLAEQTEELALEQIEGCIHYETKKIHDTFSCLEIKAIMEDEKESPTYRVSAAGYYRDRSMIRVSEVNGRFDALIEANPESLLRIIAF